MTRVDSRAWRKAVTAILNNKPHRSRKATAQKSLFTRVKKHQYRRRQRVRNASKKVVGDYPLKMSNLYAVAGAKHKSEQQIKQDWTTNRRQDRRWLEDRIVRGGELLPTERERQAFTRISKSSTIEEIHEALNEDEVLRHAKRLYIILLFERKEALKMQGLRDTDVAKQWWSREKAWILGGDLPEEGGLDMAYEAYYEPPEDEVVKGPDWANHTALIHGQEVATIPTMQFGASLPLPGLDDVGAEEPGDEDDRASGEGDAEEMTRGFEDDVLAREEELNAKIMDWDDGNRAAGTAEEGEARVKEKAETTVEEEDPEVAGEQSRGWRSMKPKERGLRDLATGQLNEEPRTPEDQIISYDF